MTRLPRVVCAGLFRFVRGEVDDLYEMSMVLVPHAELKYVGLALKLLVKIE